MANEYILMLAVFVPTLGAFVLPLMASAPRLRNALAFVFVLAALVGSLALVPTVLSGRTVDVRLNLPLGLNFVLHADGLAVFMAIVSSLLSTIIVLFSTGYIRHYDYQNEYYLMVVLFLGAMMGLVYAGNLILLYVFWEITAIASWRLIGFFREKQHVIRADKAFLVTVFGALAMLLGFVGVYVQTGSFDLEAIRTTLTAAPLGTLAVVLMVGFISRKRMMPRFFAALTMSDRAILDRQYFVIHRPTKMLADGAAARFELPFLEVFFEGFLHRLKVKTLMGPEFVILRNKNRLDDIRRDLGQRHPSLNYFFLFTLFCPFLFPVFHEGRFLWVDLPEFRDIRINKIKSNT